MGPAAILYGAATAVQAYTSPGRSFNDRSQSIAAGRIRPAAFLLFPDIHRLVCQRSGAPISCATVRTRVQGINSVYIDALKCRNESAAVPQAETTELIRHFRLTRTMLLRYWRSAVDSGPHTTRSLGI